MSTPWTDCGTFELWQEQVAAKASVRVDGGILDVTSARAWWEAEHFDSPAEARGAFKLAYQQGMDGMGSSPREWMGLDEKAFDAWMRKGTLPSDEPAPVDGECLPGECVYFVQAGEHVKIGTSTRTEARLSQAQTMNALPVKLIGTVRGDRRLEKVLHKRFDHLRVQGEWFAASLELLAFIDGLLFVESTHA
jgi:hypothetical protein